MNTSSIDKIEPDTYLNNLLNQFKANSSVIEADFITTLQKNALSQVKELTLPTQREEEWQFTNLSALYKHQFQIAQPFSVNPDALPRFVLHESMNSRIVFVNGVYSPELSDTYALPDGVFVGNLEQLSDVQKGKLVKYLGQQKGNLDIFVALNTVSLRDVAIIWATPNTVIDKPIHVLWLSVPSETPSLSQPRTLIVGENSSKLSIIEEYKSVNSNCIDLPSDKPYFNNSVTEVYLHDNAQLNHTNLQQESPNGVHIGKTAVSQGRDSIYTENELSLGSQLHRHTIEIWQAGEQISTYLNGLTVIKGKQIADTHSAVYLTAPHSTVNQLHKYILDDQAQGVFNGKIFVPKAAQLTNASQLNRNLLLSPKARINTKPELQITADNVKCSHGATVSQLEADELFYLQSRGLNETDARNLLIDAFAAEILDCIPLQSIRQRIAQCVACRTFDSDQ
ncbi:MAG: Fe-S cluster assembly protein SufD [Microcystaceae cyanobacterium]